MPKPRDSGGIRNRNGEYNPRRGLLRLLAVVGLLIGVLFLSVQIGFVGAVAEGISDSMYHPPMSTPEATQQPHTDPDSEWRLSLNRSLDARYTTHPRIAPVKIRTAQLEVLAFVNAQRVQRGAEPLFWNGELSRLNRWYAREIHEIGRGNSSHFNHKTGRFVDERAKWAGYPVERCSRYGEVIVTSVYLREFERTEKTAQR